jgi:HSP20 family protein
MRFQGSGTRIDSFYAVNESGRQAHRNDQRKEHVMNALTFARTTATAHDIFDEFFDEVERSGKATAFRPVADVTEEEGAYVLRLDLPGVSREDVRIETKGHTLSISGHRKAPEAGKGYRYCESGYGDFNRAFSLPGAVDREAIAARCENGVLVVHLFLLPEAERALAA